jgi:ribosomal protein L19E
MSKKRKVAQPVAANAKGRPNVVWRQSAEEATLASKPHYNGFACGHGAHGGVKFNRAKAKQAWKKQIRQEGASRGSFLLFDKQS